MIGISGSLIWSKTLMELMFNPFGEFRLKSGGPSHLLVGAPGIFLDLLRSVQMLKREWGAESNGSVGYCDYIRSEVIHEGRNFTRQLIKSLVKLQPWFLSLRWKTYLRQNCSLGFSACSEGPAFGQNTDDDYDESHSNPRCF